MLYCMPVLGLKKGKTNEENKLSIYTFSVIYWHF